MHGLSETLTNEPSQMLGSTTMAAEGCFCPSGPSMIGTNAPRIISCTEQFVVAGRIHVRTDAGNPSL